MGGGPGEGGSHGSSGGAVSGPRGSSSGLGAFACNGVAGALGAAASGIRNNFWGYVSAGILTAIGNCLCAPD
jgi:hypothetical protein